MILWVGAAAGVHVVLAQDGRELGVVRSQLLSSINLDIGLHHWRLEAFVCIFVGLVEVVQIPLLPGVAKRWRVAPEAIIDIIRAFFDDLVGLCLLL